MSQGEPVMTTDPDDRQPRPSSDESPEEPLDRDPSLNKDDSSDETVVEKPAPQEAPTEEPTNLTPEFCRRVEAILFTSEQPLSAHRIAGVLKARDALVKAAIRELAAQYDLEKHAFAVVEIAGGYQVLTRPEFGDLIAKLYEQARQSRLSQAALETLAIIAYKQPAMRVEIEDIRGVGVQPVLKNLLDMGLVRVVGRADALGRPLLYGTSRKFLITFGLKSPRDLPSIEDLKAGDQT